MTAHPSPRSRPARRAVLSAAVATIATLVLAGPVLAQAPYPARAVTIIVPFAAGGFTDNVARLLAKGLSDRWHVPVVVDNRPGAGGNLGGAIAAKAAPDGYTLFLANAATNGINPAIYKKMSFDAMDDFEPVTLIVRSPNLLSVNNQFPARSVKELVAEAKAHPGRINYGTPGAGTTGHLTGALFASVAGIDIVHVPYKGSPQVMTDLQAGSVQIAFDNVTSWAPQAQAGRLRPLAVTSAKRSPLLPDVPTMAEAGFPAVESTSWSGLAAPRGTPAAVIEKIHADAVAVLQAPEFKAAMNGGEVVGNTPAAFRSFIRDEIGKWKRIADGVNLRVD